ncbi:MAG: carboxylate--amine ligase [Desulfosarcinaceae bacterium]|nr:carboxylate--amine ligase [Desulfosarcinaceae bacterium]
MNVVFLSPHFPEHYAAFCTELRAAGATVLGIADAPYEALSPAVREALAAYYRVDDLHDYDGLVRALGYFTHKYGKLERCESLNEYWLATEARLRDDFNIEGIRGHQIDAIRRKSEMKQRFRQADVAVAPGRVVHDLAQARALVAETGYPVVAKPDAGVGALDTYRLDSDHDLEALFEAPLPADYILEGFVTGAIVSFDGLADREGRLVFATGHRYSQGIMETVNEGRHISYTSLREIPPRLEELGRRCVAAFEARERFFHIEFFHQGGDDYVGLEINMRPPGGFTTDMFNYACDIDIYRTWARLLVHDAGRLAYERKYHCSYASRKNGIPYTHSHGEIMERFGGDIVKVASVPGVFSSALGDVGYIFRSPEIERNEEIIRFIHATSA